MNEARSELERTLQSYPGTYKFRINHITCTEETVLEMSGKQNILGE